MRKFLVPSGQAVEAVIHGLLTVSPYSLDRVPGHLGLVYRGNEKRRIRIIVGGGSGHEPLFLGAVGPGMADAGIAGEIFAAPNPVSIQATTEALGPCEGVVYLYGNYSGDVLNFDFAAEEVESAGIKTAQIRVHDDVASAPPERLEARRGIAGDVFVLKCTAAAADLGLPLEEVVRLGEKVNVKIRSIGVALQAASSVDTGEPMFDLPTGLLEIGMGLHGEMGVSRSEFEPAETLVPKMVEMLLADFKATQTSLERVAMMINGLGGATVLEVLAVAGHAHRALEARGVQIQSCVAGEFATSLDMSGFSITLLPLDDETQPLFKADGESFCFTRRL